MSEKNRQKGKTVKNGKNKGAREEYLKELKSILKKVPDEGLLFLIKQAGILIHNAEAEKSMQAASRMDDSQKTEDSLKYKPPAEISGKKGKTLSGKSDTVEVALEKGAFGKSFILRFSGKGKAFSDKEIASLIRHAHESKTAAEGRRRIFAWFERNRKDVLIDTAMNSEDSPAVKGVYKCLKDRISQK